MDFSLSEKQLLWQGRVRDFITAHVRPAEQTYWKQLSESDDRWVTPPVVEDLKRKAIAAS